MRMVSSFQKVHLIMPRRKKNGLTLFAQKTKQKRTRQAYSYLSNLTYCGIISPEPKVSLPLHLPILHRSRR